jgi:hypothetical protein
MHTCKLRCGDGIPHRIPLDFPQVLDRSPPIGAAEASGSLLFDFDAASEVVTLERAKGRQRSTGSRPRKGTRRAA